MAMLNNQMVSPGRWVPGIPEPRTTPEKRARHVSAQSGLSGSAAAGAIGGTSDGSTLGKRQFPGVKLC